MSKLVEDIKKLKKQLNAIILAHNYQIGEVQDIADFVGDSLELAQKASKTDADVVVFCGVHFMAETAAIISPEKKVLLPDKNAGCPLANMITPRELLNVKKQYPDAIVVTYVNSSAEIKAESDYCCTSSNAVKVVNHIPENQSIIFVPDKNLANYIAKISSRKNIIPWAGFCPTHQRITKQDILTLKKSYPEAKVIVHPECRSDVIDIADKVGSTSYILRFASETNAKTIIVGTEIGIIHRLKKENPQKEFIPASEHAYCPNMKLITLEKILWTMEDLQPIITVPLNIAENARNAIKRMLQIV